MPLDGPAQKPTGYRIQIDGSFSFPTGPDRLGLNVDITFDTNRDWQEVGANFKLRPGKEEWHLHSKASEQTLRYRMNNVG